MQALANAVRAAVAPAGILLCHRPTLAAIAVRACRRCGCTQQCACPEGCAWEEEDLCSACGDAERSLTGRLSVAGHRITIRPSRTVLVTAPATGGLWDGTLIFSWATWERTLISIRTTATSPDVEEGDDGAVAGRLDDLAGASEHCLPEPVAVAALDLFEAYPQAALSEIVPLVSSLAEHLGDREGSFDTVGAVRWLSEPQASIGGAIPMRLLAEGREEAVIAAVALVLGEKTV